MAPDPSAPTDHAFEENGQRLFDKDKKNGAPERYVAFALSTILGVVYYFSR
jgi:hypothetical protein